MNSTYKSHIKSMNKYNLFIEKTIKIYSLALKMLCQDFPQFNIILKPHPRESNHYYQDITAKNFFVIKDVPLLDVLESVDLAVHWTSTVAIECWIRKIKTLQYVPLLKNKNYLIESHPGDPTIYNYKQLKKAIAKYSENDLEQKYLDFQKKYLKYNFYQVDGKSVDRIAAKINKLNAKSTPKLNYLDPKSFKANLLVILQNVFGLRVSRIMIALFDQDYDWRYASNNYVFK